MMRVLWGLLLALAFTATGWAQERITNYDVVIDVQQDADFIVTESISVVSEGQKIRRGIFRDLPRYKVDEEAAGREYKIPYQYKILSVTRNGQREPFSESSGGNAKKIRVGDADYYLPRGPHDYVITYEVKNEVRYNDTFDEVYWNAIGTYWDFPIERGKAVIRFPQSIAPQEINCYTGRFGSNTSNCQMSRDAQTFTVETLQPLNRREGMAVSIKFNKGIIDPPSQSDKTMLWWFKHGALALLTFSMIALFGYYYRAWNKVGRDPQKDPVFARYEPPMGYSPAAVHHVHYRGFRQNKVLISTLMHLAINKHIKMDSTKSETVLTYLRGDGNPKSITPDQAKLMKHLFASGLTLRLGKKTNMAFTRAYTAFQLGLQKRYGKDYFRWNIGYTILGIILSVIAIGAAFTQFYGNNSDYFFIILGALIGMNLLFIFIMPAPTVKGQKIKSEIEGFKLYLEMAEKQQLNARKDVLSGQEPPMTKERYEAFLPYAIALDVEKPWSKYFEKVLPQEAKEYSPSWGHVSGRNFGSVGGINRALESNLNSGVSRAMPQSSSSSGGRSSGGGGGFSGGGGGGGGGGGW
jgi:uncharacterized membrane protein YgcG